MRRIGTAVAVLIWGFASQAQAWTCTLTPDPCETACDTLTARFEINASQFAAPQNANDPPRRQVTEVTLGPATFIAEAIRMEGGIEGFFEDAGALGSRLMIVQPDGQARLSLRPANKIWTGTCRR